LHLAWLRWSVRIRRLAKPLLVIATIGTVLGGIAGYLNFYRTLRAPVVAVPRAAPSLPVGDVRVQPLSILIFPLGDASGDPAKHYIAAGLTSAILTGLSRIRGAVVVPPLTSVALRDQKLTLQELGERAHVNYVVDGNVTEINDRLRIVVQLASAQRGQALWTRTFDGSTADVFAIQDRITSAIQGTVGPSLVVAEAREAEKRQRSPQVADLLIRAEAHRWQPDSLENDESRAQLCQQALRLEPDNVQGLECVATSLAHKADWLETLRQTPRTAIDPVRAQSEAAARRALALDPSSVAALIAIGINAKARNDTQTARNAFERVIAIDPEHLPALNNLGGLLRDVGEIERSYEVLTRAAGLPSYGDPVYPWTNLAITCVYMRRPEEAITWAQRVLRDHPDHLQAYVPLALAYGALDRTAEARVARAELMKRSPRYTLDLDSDPPWPGREAQQRDLIDYLRRAARVAGIPE
jgi:TolB-like protein/Flp pilus assembly protein TadD